MIVKECMTKNVELVTPTTSLTEAAMKMRDGDFGILPVQDNDRLVGMLSDRDITVRCVAEGLDYRNLNVGQVMSEKVFYCFEDQDIDEVTRNLGDNQIRRLPVLNRQKRLVGIVALSDLTEANIDSEKLHTTLNKIAQPGDNSLQA